MDVAQGVHDALEWDASQRPATERDVEPLPRHVDPCLIVGRDLLFSIDDLFTAGFSCDLVLISAFVPPLGQARSPPENVRGAPNGAPLEDHNQGALRAF